MNLTDEQLSAINELDSNLRIIACAGSGKTEVISRRIAKILLTKKDVEPSNMVAFTFTEKAAESLKNRIQNRLLEGGYQNDDISEMYVGTIHAFCFAMLKKIDKKYENYKILNSAKHLYFLDRYSGDLDLDKLNINTGLRSLELYEKCIERMIASYRYIDLWSSSEREVFEKYQQKLEENKYISFPMIMFKLQQEIDKNGISLFSSIKYLTVDEYQDVDDLQEMLISNIASAGANICVVGDDDQTIYQFRGSNADNIINFDNRYPSVRTISLSQNFRSTYSIVDIANTFICNNRVRLSKNMISGSGLKNGVCNGQGYESEEEEIASICEMIRRYYFSGVSYSDMAILFRKNKLVKEFYNELTKRGIPCHANDSDVIFEDNDVKKYIATINAILTQDSEGINSLWIDTVDRKTLIRARRVIFEEADGIGKKPVKDLFMNFLELIGISPSGIINGFCEIIQDFDEIYKDCQAIYRLQIFDRFIEDHTDILKKIYSFDLNTEEGVNIMTIHKSKGLEYKCVFLPRLQQKQYDFRIPGKKVEDVLSGYFVRHKSEFESDDEDERKLFYVALTRAISNLHLTYIVKKKPVSKKDKKYGILEFLPECAESNELDIDHDDLLYTVEYIDEIVERNKARREELIEKMHDVYCTEMRLMHSASFDMSDVYNMNLDELESFASSY